MIKWLLFLLAVGAFIELIHLMSRNTGDAYYKAAMNEQFGCSTLKTGCKFYVLSGKMDGNKEDVIRTLEKMGCVKQAA